MKKTIISSSIFILAGIVLISCGSRSVKYPEHLKNTVLEASLQVDADNLEFSSERGRKKIKVGPLGSCMRNTDYKKITLEELKKQLPDIANRVKVKTADDGKTKYIFRFKLIKWKTHFSRSGTTNNLDAVASLVERETGAVIWMKELGGHFKYFLDFTTVTPTGYQCGPGLRGILKKHIRTAVEHLQK